MESDFKHALKSNNLSLTSVRLAVLNTLADNPHSDAPHIYNLVKSQIETTSLQAIYNNLNTLVNKGIVREIKPKGSLSLYETRMGDNHHHLVCRQCQSVTDVDCAGFAPCLTPDHNHGFDIDEAEITFWGLCLDCQSNFQSKPKFQKGSQT